MNLMSLNNKGWATIIHHDPEPTTATLISEQENGYCLPLSVSDLIALCLCIATPTGIEREVYLPDEEIKVKVKINVGKNAVEIDWGKKKVCTLNTIDFLTQAAPQFLDQYLNPPNWNRR